MAGPARCLAIRELQDGQPSPTFALGAMREAKHLCRSPVR